MAKLIFIPAQNINKYCFRQDKELSAQAYYLCFGTVLTDSEITAFSTLKIQRYFGHKFDQEFRREFIFELNRCFGRLAQVNDPFYWQATDLASKNRFTTRMPELARCFLDVVQAAKDKNFNAIYIIGLPDVLVEALKPALKKVNCEAKFLLRQPNDSFLVLKGFLRRLAAVVYNVIKIYSRHCYSCKKLAAKFLAKPNEKYYVVKSFVYNHSFGQNSSYNDVFFGSLLDYLRNKKNVLIYACVLGQYRQCVDKMAQVKQYPVLPVEFFLGIKDLLLAAWHYVFRPAKFNLEFNLFGHDLASVLKQEILRKFGGVQFFHFVHFYATKNLLNYLALDKFFLTYENNPWEKMCILALKRFSPDTEVVGYQHTVVPQASLNMFLNQQEIAVGVYPERILTVGFEPKKIIEQYSQYPLKMVQEACALRFEYLNKVKPILPQGRKNILIALEGIYEVYQLVNYVLAEITKDSGYNVLIRTHPTLPLKFFKAKLICDFGQAQHIKFSESASTLKDDIIWSDIVIYWGTTVALEALSLGKPLVHYDLGTALSYDPLFACSYLKWTVNRQVRLKPVLDEISNLPLEKYRELFEKAQNYLNSYFYPVTPDRLAVFA